MAENSVSSLLCWTKYCNLNTEIIKSLAVQRLKKFEEQCIHHYNLIKSIVSFQKHKEIALTSFGQFHHVFEN